MTKHFTAFLAISAAYLMGSTAVSSALAAEIVTASTTGMTCAECAGSVEAKLMENDAVEAVDIDVETGTVIVTVKDGSTFTNDDLAAIIDWAGYDIVEMTRSENT